MILNADLLTKVGSNAGSKAPIDLKSKVTNLFEFFHEHEYMYSIPFSNVVAIHLRRKK